MRFRTLVFRSLKHYRRTHTATALGVAIAVAVLAGALMVGESVRASLRDLVFQRLGNTNQVLSGRTFFREALAGELGGVPVIAFEGMVAGEGTGRKAMRVQVWGVDDRFWRFHSREPRPGAFVSQALADELGVNAGDAVLLSVEKPSAIPAESLHGRKESGQAIRLTLAGSLTAGQLGEFSLRPRQGAVRNLFVPLELLQRRLERRGRANLALLGQPVSPAAVRDKVRLEDLGIRLRPIEGGLAVESESAILDDSLARAVTGVKSAPVFTYLANGIRARGREIPYSLVAATDQAGVSPGGIALNEWTARELGARAGDEVVISYYVWRANGRLETESAAFRLERVLPMSGLGADRELAPEYPGITDTGSLSDWDPPFPLDLSRVRPADEEYWRRYRAAPKTFIALARGQQLWATRFGKLTSIRVYGTSSEAFGERLRSSMDPAGFGLTLDDVRGAGFNAAAGATDFGEYFTYFSFFLVVAALLLAGLFFRLGVEERIREIGALRALGFSQSAVTRLLMVEALAVAVPGVVLGAAGAIAYAGLIVHGLGTWWVGAVGTTLLTLHVSAAPLVSGAAGGLAIAMLFLAVSMWPLRRISPRSLLAGVAASAERRGRRMRVVVWVGGLSLAAAILLALAAARGVAGQAGAFFGAGGLLLVGTLCLEWVWLVRRHRRVLETLPGLGARYASHRPARSVLILALIGAAAFVIVSVDSFRKDDSQTDGTGRLALIAESVLPVYHDLNTREGRENLGLPERELAGTIFHSFRVRPGDDASCLNLYRPQNPRIVAPPRGFPFGGRTDAWPLLDRAQPDGAIPAIVDANSLKYTFHRKLGDGIEISGGVRLRFVGVLSGSVFQSEVIVSPENFLRAVPREEGFRMFAIETPDAPRVAALLEETLADYGFDAVSTRERLAAFHRVENTYLSTFQALGALGLLVGTAGLGAVLMRNVLERRRETALLRAIGYTPGSLRIVLLSEILLLLAAGLATGTLPALVAVAPAWLERGGGVPLASAAALLGAVLVTGLTASIVALRFAMRAPLIAALRSE